MAKAMAKQTIEETMAIAHANGQRIQCLKSYRRRDSNLPAITPASAPGRQARMHHRQVRKH